MSDLLHSTPAVAGDGLSGAAAPTSDNYDDGEKRDIGVEDIFGAEGLEDEFSDLEELPDSDDDEPKQRQAAVSKDAGPATVSSYAFSLPRYKKRDYSATDTDLIFVEDEHPEGEQGHSPTDLARFEDSPHQQGQQEGEDAATSTANRTNTENAPARTGSNAAKEFMDSVIKDIKGSSGRSKRRRKDTDLEESSRMDMAAADLTRAMQNAALNDLESHGKEQPGFAKIMLLEDVVLAMNRVHMHDFYLESNILDAIRTWLEPLPDRSLPSLDIQQAMFKILDDLPISTEHLRESGIGRITLFYIKNKKVQPHIQRMADRLINKWSRPILGLSDDYRTRRLPTVNTSDRATHSFRDTSSPASQRTTSSASSSSHTDTQREPPQSGQHGSAVATARARVPTSYLPTFNVMPLPGQEVQIARATLAKNKDPLKKIKQKMNIMKRHSGPSGRH